MQTFHNNKPVISSRLYILLPHLACKLTFVQYPDILIDKRRDLQGLDFYFFAILVKEPVAILVDDHVVARAELTIRFRDHFTVTTNADW